jgi:O-antigen ligase
VYLETGILGLAAYLAVLAALARAAAKALRTSPSGLGRGVAVGFAACLAAMVVESIGGNVVGQVAALWYFFAFAAVGSASSLRTIQPAAAATEREIVSEAVNAATR